MKVMHTSNYTPPTTKVWLVGTWDRCLDCSWRTL